MKPSELSSRLRQIATAIDNTNAKGVPVSAARVAADLKNVVASISAVATMGVSDDWYPAHDGKEEPFTTRSGYRLQYVYQPSTGKHAYLNLDNDLILSDEEAEAALGK